MTFPTDDSVKLNKINTFQRGFAVILSKSLLVVLKMRYMWNISNRQWKGHTNWKVLTNWPGWGEGNKEMSPRNPSDCNLILKSKRRRKENITGALPIELKEQETAVVECRKANAWRKAKYLTFRSREDYRACKLPESPCRESCSFLKGKRHTITKLITITLPSNISFKNKCVLKRDHK